PPERSNPADLPIADDVHTRLALLAHHLGCHGPYPTAECLPVVRLPTLDCPHRLRNIRRTGEPAGMGREDAVCAPLHGLPPNVLLSCAIPLWRDKVGIPVLRYILNER